MGLSINKGNYHHFKEVARIVWEEMGFDGPVPLKPEDQPISILDSWEQHSEALARRGLQEGLRDAVSSLRYCSQETLVRMDRRLKAKDLLGVAAIQAIVLNTLKKVLKRGTIRSLDEFYVVKEMLDDPSSDLAVADRARLGKVMGTFEARGSATET